MIVVISHGADLHATRVVAELENRGLGTFLFDVADFPHKASLTIDYTSPQQPMVIVTSETGHDTRLDSASSVWWRRPQFPDLSSVTDSAALGFAHGEWNEALNGLYALLDCPWMNPPGADEFASRKALQLVVAERLGLKPPRTLITSDATKARQFASELGIGNTIYKIFSATQEVWRETRVLKEEDLAGLDTSLHLAPVIFQEYVRADADIRVTVVGTQVFAMKIHTKGTSYEADFRLSLEEAATESIELPSEVERRLFDFMNHFGLVYGAIDFRLEADGTYVFLEINTAGEFLFVEAGTGLPITAAVCDWLAEPRPTHH